MPVEYNEGQSVARSTINGAPITPSGALPVLERSGRQGAWPRSGTSSRRSPRAADAMAHSVTSATAGVRQQPGNRCVRVQSLGNHSEPEAFSIHDAGINV